MKYIKYMKDIKKKNEVKNNYLQKGSMSPDGIPRTCCRDPVLHHIHRTENENGYDAIY